MGDSGNIVEANPWDEYIERTQQYLATGKLESEELTYKRETASGLAAVRRALLAGEDNWADPMNDEPLRDYLNNLCGWRYFSHLRHWFYDDPDASDAMRALWAQDDQYDVVERIRAFAGRLPREMGKGTGTRLRPLSVLLMGLDAEQYPVFKVTEFKNTYTRIKYPKPPKDADEGALYGHALRFLDRFIKEAKARELDRPRNRLEAQSVVWVLEQERDVVDSPPPTDPPTDLQTLADELLFDVEHLHKIEQLLDDKRQVIFQGPPGTGKTFVARKLANCLSGSKERVRLVQFHPSYAYEDFVQGYRPALIDGQPSFKRRKGPLLEAAEKARAEPAAKHFLVIDEINRGNLSKVFGELYFLLEYRDAEMRLLYADEPFSLPDNLYIIGTMNTADRSIALVDLALRRRFHFVEFHPDKPPVKGLLRRWLNKNAADLAQVANVVDLANEKLGDRQAAIGPSYFIKPELDEERLRLIWEHNVLPYVEEHLYGEHDLLSEFRLDKLWDKTLGGDEGQKNTANADGPTNADD